MNKSEINQLLLSALPRFTNKIADFAVFEPLFELAIENKQNIIKAIEIFDAANDTDLSYEEWLFCAYEDLTGTCAKRPAEGARE